MLPSNVLSNVYNSVIKPHFEYCISIFGNARKKYFSKLQRIQNRAARIVYNNYDFTVKGIDLVHRLKWLNVDQLRDLQ